MKYIYTLIVLIFFSASINAQNCKPTYTIIPPNIISFNPPFGFPSPQFIYNWDFGDGTSMIDFAPVHVYSQTGNLTVTLTIYDSAMTTVVCTDTAVISLNFCNPSFQQDTVDMATFHFNSNLTGSSTASWEFGDGQVATGNSVSHSYLFPGFYVVTMFELDSNGANICTSTLIVSWSSNPNCSFDVTQPDPAGLPALYNLNALVANSNGTVSWDFGDGTPPVSGYSVQKTFSQTGLYNVCMTFIDGADTCVSCQLINVITLTGNCAYNYYQNSSSYLSFDFLSPVVNNGSLYSWDFGDGNFGNGPVISHTFASPGSYIVCLSEIDSLSGAQLCYYCDVIEAIPPPPICTFNYSLQAGITNGVSFTAPLFVGTTYVWDFGDGTSDSSTFAFTQHQYAGPAIYFVTLTTYFNNTLVCTATLPVDLTLQNWYCQANFTSVSLGMQTFFIDQSVAIPLNLPPVQPPVNYFWDFNDGNTSTLQFPQHTFGQPGTYIVCLTVTIVGCTTTYCAPVTVDTAIIIPISCNAYFIFTQLTPYNMVAVNLSNGVNLNFSWDFGDGSPISNLPYPIHQYTSTGTYPLCLTVSDNNGCTDTYCDSLTVDSAGNILYRATVAGFMLNVVSPADLTTEIRANENIITEIYPVPAVDQLYIKMSNSVKEEVAYAIYNVEGRSVMNGFLSNAKTELNISNLKSGIYMLRLTGDKITDSRTFLKQ